MRAVCLMGPTAAGKTGVAIELLRAADIGADFELIRVDSAQVYRHMNIGTAKPSADVLREFPHRLINIRDPWESYSAGNFCRDVTAAMHDISAQNKVPLLVGGQPPLRREIHLGRPCRPGLRRQKRRQVGHRRPAKHPGLSLWWWMARQRHEQTSGVRT